MKTVKREPKQRPGVVLNLLDNEPTKRILDFLERQENPITVTDIYKTLKLEQSIASISLATFRKYGLVTEEYQGRHRFYSIVPSKLNALRALYGDVKEMFLNTREGVKS